LRVVISAARQSTTQAARLVIRLICLAALLVLDDPALFANYRRRFGVSMETFRREAKRLRRTARYIDAVLHGNYRRCFRLMDSDLEYADTEQRAGRLAEGGQRCETSVCRAHPQRRR
jgi:hypothetical protein